MSDIDRAAVGQPDELAHEPHRLRMGERESGQGKTPINLAEIMDMGPIRKVPTLVGICTAHGFWFEARSQRETCPESGCLAPVHFYAWRNEYTPEGRDE